MNSHSNHSRHQHGALPLPLPLPLVEGATATAAHVEDRHNPPGPLPLPPAHSNNLLLIHHALDQLQGIRQQGTERLQYVARTSATAEPGAGQQHDDDSLAAIASVAQQSLLWALQQLQSVQETLEEALQRGTAAGDGDDAAFAPPNSTAHPLGHAQAQAQAQLCTGRREQEGDSTTAAATAAARASSSNTSNKRKRSQSSAATTAASATNESSSSEIPPPRPKHHGPKKPYQRRALAPLPNYPPPSQRNKYTKRESLEILSNITDKKQRQQVIRNMIAQQQIPVTTASTMNKYLREYHKEKIEKGSNDTMEECWENDVQLDEAHIPPPQNASVYGRQEAVRILLSLPTSKQRLALTSRWMATGKLGVTSVSAVSRAIRQAQQKGIESLPGHWGRWGDHGGSSSTAATASSSPSPSNKKDTKRNTTTTKTTTTTIASTAYKKAKPTLLPPHPPPKFGSQTQYTKVEAISILQKITLPSDRTALVWDWIHSGKIPVNHPNSMLRMVRQAEQGTLQSMDWKQAYTTTMPAAAGAGTAMAPTKDNTSPADTSSASIGCWVPPPLRNNCYSKAEMIQHVSQFNARDRHKLLRVWVQQGKIPYTCPLSANNIIMNAMKKQTNQQHHHNKTKTKKQKTTQERTKTNHPQQPKQHVDQAAADGKPQQKDDDLEETSGEQK